VVLVCSYARHQKPLGNEYFGNAAGQNKAAEWVGYIFPTPLLALAIKGFFKKN
jgi:hypothetical protein